MILNIAAYHFTPIADPDALVARLRATAEGTGLRGTVLVADEGINLFLAGAAMAVNAFIDELRADARFISMRFRKSVSHTAPFARLKVKHKREIITFAQPACTPLATRAPSVSPETLARWIANGHDDDEREVTLLDTRNREETRLGTFVGAQTLPIDRFRDFPTVVDAAREKLADKTVVTFCTGGIRCEKAAVWMQANGIENVFQLDGGILGYFEAIGGLGYDGDCFVFDERVALDASLRPSSATSAT